MKEYHKIQNIYQRDVTTNKLIEGTYSTPEFEYLKDNKWLATEKVDGTNIRIMFDGENITYGGKTDNASIPAPLVEWLNNKFQPITMRQIFKDKFKDGVCLYGEGFGPKIQNGGNYGTIQKFVLFDVKIGDWWLERGNVVGIAEMLDIEVVPIMKEGTLDEIVDFVRNKPKSQWGDFTVEGVVARPAVGIIARNGDRIITKIKVRDFNK